MCVSISPRFDAHNAKKMWPMKYLFFFIRKILKYLSAAREKQFWVNDIFAKRAKKRGVKIIPARFSQIFFDRPGQRFLINIIFKYRACIYCLLYYRKINPKIPPPLSFSAGKNNEIFRFVVRIYRTQRATTTPTQYNFTFII